MLEKKEDGDSAGQEADGSSPDGGAGGDDMRKSISQAVKLGQLKVGDVVTLRGINQNMLEVAQDGTVHCGKTIKPRREGEEDPDAAASGDAASSSAGQPQDGDAAGALVPGTGCTE